MSLVDLKKCELAKNGKTDLKIDDIMECLDREPELQTRRYSLQNPQFMTNEIKNKIDGKKVGNKIYTINSLSPTGLVTDIGVSDILRPYRVIQFEDSSYMRGYNDGKKQ